MHNQTTTSWEEYIGWRRVNRGYRQLLDGNTIEKEISHTHTHTHTTHTHTHTHTYIHTHVRARPLAVFSTTAFTTTTSTSTPRQTATEAPVTKQDGMFHSILSTRRRVIASLARMEKTYNVFHYLTKLKMTEYTLLKGVLRYLKFTYPKFQVLCSSNIKVRPWLQPWLWLQHRRWQATSPSWSSFKVTLCCELMLACAIYVYVVPFQGLRYGWAKL